MLATLPDRHVTADNIEEAYVRFIFYCNPAVSPASDTATLREGFRNPPRSGGRTFHPYTVYELVRRFYAKDIKTWTELTTTLGVEPPDPSKDESAQKISQYGVRLKKWMNSMHVRAFFEYLMDMPNDYWTKVPSDPNPIACPVRDGVAVEDDMALRALIPHIRPKRGRKRPEPDDGAFSPSKRHGLLPSLVSNPDYRQGLQPWSAHPSSRPTAWTPGDNLATSTARWPHSAVTPSSRGSFWDDALESPCSAAPLHAKHARVRRGAKNVSSAWKPGGLDGGAKPRGRPPIPRSSLDDSHAAPQPWTPIQETRASSASHSLPHVRDQNSPELGHSPQQGYLPPSSHSGPTSVPPDLSQRHSSHDSNRLPRPNISLQVPERLGGSVRLATPPTPPTWTRHHERTEPAANCHTRSDCSNYAKTQQHVPPPEQHAPDGWQRYAKEATDAYEQATNVPSNGCDKPEHIPQYYFEKIDDRTNVDTLVSYFVRSMSDSEWIDHEGNPDEPSTVEESTALVNAMLENMFKTATSPQAFLINLAALAGSMTLVTARPKCIRMGKKGDANMYKCDWEYRFGHVKCRFTMTQDVPCSMWCKGNRSGDHFDGVSAASEVDRLQRDAGLEGKGQEESPLSAADWKRKYRALVDEVEKRNRELANLRGSVMKCLGREWMAPS
ncbi:hypothetical protein CDD81_6513 [Ophiocordyceps australis]|uniref:Uncharacterized protein n=1 Tax=Ophiocordyceps australis TaxID=1399860 RepID=A0A2C5YG47_9HYPO|nr:hypothetical protein CDD81_6513 [Ophiocordyceps australis]